MSEIVAAYLDEKDMTASRPDRLHDAWKALKPTFEPLRPDQITRTLCQEYTRQRRNAGRADGTILKELSILRAALRWHNPATPAMFDMPAAPRRRERFLTRDEYQSLLSACRTPYLRLFVTLALATAGRTQALLELTWDRVDFAAARIDLRTVEVGPRKGRAVVPMTTTASDALKEAHKARTSDYVIEHAGRPLKRIIKGFRATAKRADLVGVTPHTLRHTAAVWMADAADNNIRDVNRIFAGQTIVIPQSSSGPR